MTSYVTSSKESPKMVFLLLLVVIIAVGAMAYFAIMHRGYEREAREAFEATLNPKERERLEGFSSIRSWRDYMTLNHAEREWRASRTAKKSESHTEPHV
jgi:hypothetical protein